MVVTFLIALWVTIFYASIVVLSHPLDPKATRFRWRFAKRWGAALTRAFGIRLRVHGDPAASPGAAVLICNHSSSYDIYVVAGATPRPIRWISKNSIRYIPFVGWAMISLHACFLKRNQSRGDRERLNQMAERLGTDGATVVIFPEGTRIRTGELGEFKKGAFHMAKIAGVQMIPAFLKGTRDVKKNSRIFWRVRHDVDLAFGPPIPAADVQRLSVDELMKRGRQAIEALQKQYG